MRGESRVEIALLVLLTTAYYSDADANSELIGEAAGCSPVIVRRIYRRLKDAGLLDTKPGRYGLHLVRDPKDISLLDVVEAVNPLDPGTVFKVEAPLSGTSPIADSLFTVVQGELSRSIERMRDYLATVSLHDLAAELPSAYGVPPEDKCKEIAQYMVDASERHGDKVRW